MELKLNFGYIQLLDLIKQLLASQPTKLKSELDSTVIVEKIIKDISSRQKLIVNGLLMTDEQFNIFKEHRKNSAKWRNK